MDGFFSISNSISCKFLKFFEVRMYPISFSFLDLDIKKSLRSSFSIETVDLTTKVGREFPSENDVIKKGLAKIFL